LQLKYNSDIFYLFEIAYTFSHWKSSNDSKVAGSFFQPLHKIDFSSGQQWIIT